jgi:hypothetical protein
LEHVVLLQWHQHGAQTQHNTLVSNHIRALRQHNTAWQHFRLPIRTHAPRTHAPRRGRTRVLLAPQHSAPIHCACTRNPVPTLQFQDVFCAVADASAHRLVPVSCMHAMMYLLGIHKPLGLHCPTLSTYTLHPTHEIPCHRFLTCCRVVMQSALLLTPQHTG